MKRRILSLLLSLCMLLSFLYLTAMAEEISHKHILCIGASCADSNHSTHYDITWDAVLSNNSLPSSAGNYYLTSDITLSETWTVSEDISLDLNGHTISLDTSITGSVINISSGTFNLIDCKGSGKVTGGNATNGGGIYISAGAVFNLYGGNITGSMTANVYGGGDVYKGGTFNTYGGVYGGVWGGIDWTLAVNNSNGTGKLTISKTTQAPETLEIKPTSTTGERFEPGYWREGICYSPENYYYPWNYNKVTEIEIKSGVTGIGTFAAQNMASTGKLHIPNTVNYIGWEAFAGSKFTEVTFEERDETCGDLCIAQGAFKKVNMKEIILPEGLKCIHAWVFAGCISLENVTIPASIERMSGQDHRYDYGRPGSADGSSAIFAGNPNMKTITFADENDKNAFLNNSVIGQSSSNSAYITPSFSAVAGNAGYVDLQDAIDAAGANGTVALMNDTTISSGTTIEIPEGVVLDLNNKTLTNNGTIVNFGLLDESEKLKNNNIYAKPSSSADITLADGSENPVDLYTISYDLNGGTVERTNPDYYIESEEFTLNNPTKTGYTFKGWSGTGLDGDENTDVTVSTGSTGDRVYTANWTANTYDIIFDANGASGEMQKLSLSYDEEKVLTENAFSYSRKDFIGWNTKADGSGDSFDDKEIIKNLVSENGAEVALYAQWRDKVYYDVIYKANGEIVETFEVEEGKDVPAIEVPAKEGYNAKWDKDGKNITSDTEINAVYTINKYTVTFKADGETVKTETVEHGKDASKVEVPSKHAHTGAWDKDGKNITADTEINAVYTKIIPGEYQDVTPQDNILGGKIDEKAEGLKEFVPVTEEEIKAVENGKDVKIWVEFNDVSKTLSDNDKKVIDEALEKDTVGIYLDINIYKQVGENEVVKITELNEKVTITMKVPENLINKDSKINRTYKVVRVHEGKVDVLDAVFDEKAGTISFETDRFSTYTIVYTDEAKDTPKTGDTTNMFFHIILLLASGYLALALIEDEKNKITV